MPPEGYTNVKIWDETAAKLAEIVVEQELESIAEAIDYAADAVRDPETLSEAELAPPLSETLGLSILQQCYGKSTS